VDQGFKKIFYHTRIYGKKESLGELYDGLVPDFERILLQSDEANLFHINNIILSSWEVLSSKRCVINVDIYYHSINYNRKRNTNSYTIAYVDVNNKER
jgi:hypothetical protein